MAQGTTGARRAPAAGNTGPTIFSPSKSIQDGIKSNFQYNQSLSLPQSALERGYSQYKSTFSLMGQDFFRSALQSKPIPENSRGISHHQPGPSEGNRIPSPFLYEPDLKLENQHMYQHLLMFVCNTKERLNGDRSRMLQSSMKELGLPPDWCSNPLLFALFCRLRRLDMFNEVLQVNIKDIWLPLSKRVVRKWISNDKELASFMKSQELCLDERSVINSLGQHFCFDDFEEMRLEEVDFLGSGGTGEVFRVKSRHNGQEFACKSMKRPGMHQKHQELMVNFGRELSAMRRVQHRHCVTLVASCTTLDSVTILSSPIADMDLAQFLNADLDTSQMATLSKAIGCITSALTYLHLLDIRHGDMKPQNVLVRGSDVLLTDFGFCLDTSDTSVTTTVGTPKHYTMRYAAPEVFGTEPRSRLSDIWSLGCVLADIVSRLYGYKLQEMYDFWDSTGSKVNSYAENLTATVDWMEKLSTASQTAQTNPVQHDNHSWLISFIKHVLLQPKRLMRPTSAQVFARLQDVSQIRSVHRNSSYVGSCCMELKGRPNKTLRIRNAGSNTSPVVSNPSQDLAPGPLDVYGPNGLRFLFLDTRLSILSQNVPVMGNDVNGIPSFIKSNVAELTTAVGGLIRKTQGTPSQKPNWNDPIIGAGLKTADFIASIYSSCSPDVVTSTHSLQYNSQSARPMKVVAQLVLATLQLERRPLYGAPFIAMIVRAGDIGPDMNSSMAQYETKHHPSSNLTTAQYGGLHQQEDQHLSPESEHLRISTILTEAARKHMYKHRRDYVCGQPGCPRGTDGFTTVHDLDRHLKEVHRIGVSATSYQCAAITCMQHDKIWPRLPSFMEHISLMHKDENAIDLINRSEYRPLDGLPRRK